MYNKQYNVQCNTLELTRLLERIMGVSNFDTEGLMLMIFVVVIFITTIILGKTAPMQQASRPVVKMLQAINY